MADFVYRSEAPPSKAVLEAQARRLGRASDAVARTEWFIDEVLDKVNTSLRQRVKIATELVKSKVVLNISRPVTKIRVGNRTRITDRSKPGEFPKADTTLLLKTIFGTVIEEQKGIVDGVVGTPLSYGLILELTMNRSFLVRTLNEERDKVVRILTGPII